MSCGADATTTMTIAALGSGMRLEPGAQARIRPRATARDLRPRLPRQPPRLSPMDAEDEAGEEPLLFAVNSAANQAAEAARVSSKSSAD